MFRCPETGLQGSKLTPERSNSGQQRRTQEALGGAGRDVGRFWINRSLEEMDGDDRQRIVGFSGWEKGVKCAVVNDEGFRQPVDHQEKGA